MTTAKTHDDEYAELRRSNWWYCNVCRSQNHETDGECQYCECGGPACRRDNCSDPMHFEESQAMATARILMLTGYRPEDDQYAELTTDHAASSYGIPVLVWRGVPYGPDDQMPDWQGDTAREVVEGAIDSGWTQPADEELQLYRTFLGASVRRLEPSVVRLTDLPAAADRQEE